MLPYLREHFGNPSSNHAVGQRAHQAVEYARSQLANLLQCHSNEIVFTSGGSEANNLALKGIASKVAHQGLHIVISAVEHPAVMEVAHYLRGQGFRISYLPVDGQGIVHPADLEEIITSKTILVSVLHANNEVGSIQPIRELADIAHQAGALFHTDAAQSVSKVPVNTDELACDLLSLAGHKFYAPKGVGVLYVKQGVELEPLIHGADHELGRRAGTENVAQIVGLGKAAELADLALEKEISRIESLRDDLQLRFGKSYSRTKNVAIEFQLLTMEKGRPIFTELGKNDLFI